VNRIDQNINLLARQLNRYGDALPTPQWQIAYTVGRIAKDAHKMSPQQKERLSQLWPEVHAIITKPSNEPKKLTFIRHIFRSIFQRKIVPINSENLKGVIRQNIHKFQRNNSSETSPSHHSLRKSSRCYRDL
jgi:hypothetical protein